MLALHCQSTTSLWHWRKSQGILPLRGSLLMTTNATREHGIVHTPSKTNTKYFGRHLRETDTAAEMSKLERTGIIKEAGEGLLQIRNSGLLVTVEV